MGIVHHFLLFCLSPVLRRPLLCIALLWIAGILCACHLALSWQSWTLAGVILLLTWVILQARQRAPATVALALAVISFGALRVAWQSAAQTPGDSRYLPHGGVCIYGYPTTSPDVQNDRWHTTFRLVARTEGSHRQPASGDIYLTGAGEPPIVGCYYQILGRHLPDEEPNNPIGFSWSAYLRERNLAYLVHAILVHKESGQAPISLLASTRSFVTRRMQAISGRTYGDIYTNLLCGIVLGVHGVALSPDLIEQFRRAGTVHLLVVSGSQVALLAFFLLFPFFFVPRGQVGTTYPRLRMLLLLLSLPVLLLYVLLADRGPSVDRALIMVLLAIVSVFLGFSPLARQRSLRPDGLTSLACASLIILIVNPYLLFGPGMQLSFAAMLGLIVVTPPLLRLLYRTLGKLAMLPAATFSAQLFTCPVLAWHFGAIPLFGLLTNLIAIPIVMLLVPLGLITMLCAVTVPTIAGLLNHVDVWLLEGLLRANIFVAGLPGAEWRWVIHSAWPVLGYFTILMIAVLLMSRWVHRLEKEWTIPAGREPQMW